jgi:hypothetical protein
MSQPSNHTQVLALVCMYHADCEAGQIRQEAQTLQHGERRTAFSWMRLGRRTVCMQHNKHSRYACILGRSLKSMCQEPITSNLKGSSCQISSNNSFRPASYGCTKSRVGGPVGTFESTRRRLNIHKGSPVIRTPYRTGPSRHADAVRHLAARTAQDSRRRLEMTRSTSLNGASCGSSAISRDVKLLGAWKMRKHRHASLQRPMCQGLPATVSVAGRI